MQFVHMLPVMYNYKYLIVCAICLYLYLYNYIIPQVCLFVLDSHLNYAKNSHQSLRDYREPPGRTTPYIGATHPAVSMAFPIYFRYYLIYFLFDSLSLSLVFAYVADGQQLMSFPFPL